MEAVFLVAAAWIGVFGLMRLFWTAAMWVFSHVFDATSQGVPSLAPAMQSLRRWSWILIEAFLVASFLSMLVASILAACGAISISEAAHADQGDAGQPALH